MTGATVRLKAETPEGLGVSENQFISEKHGCGVIAPEISYVTTEDHWALALYRFRPSVQRRCKTPVLLLHGLGGNRVNIDPDPKFSLAYFLARKGFDVFLAELRGAGLSRPIQSGTKRSAGWGLEDYIYRDLPAIWETVRALTKADSVHGVGHSMGGMLLLAGQVHGIVPFKTISAIGTPHVQDLTFRPQERRMLGILSRLPKTGARQLPLVKLFGVAGRLGKVGAWIVDERLLNVSNISERVLSRLAMEGTDNVPLQLLVELYERSNVTTGYKGAYDYEDFLHRVDCPVLVIGGEVDGIAPAKSVEKLAMKLKGSLVRYLQVGRKWGHLQDYGHLDLMVGLEAPREVFPKVFDFLVES